MMALYFPCIGIKERSFLTVNIVLWFFTMNTAPSCIQLKEYMQIKNKLTLVIPARHEIYLQQTVDDIFTKAAGDVEILVVLDNYWPTPILRDHPNLKILHWGKRMGMRAAINAAARIGQGEYLMKVDAHCLFDEGFDLKLAANCDSDWIVVPRRYSLDADNWTVNPEKEPIDYEYLHFPTLDENKQLGLHGRAWKERARKRKEILIDEDMSFQGSCWFTPMRYFQTLMYPMDEKNYGLFIGEPQELGLKAWLSGGKNIVNKNTWYAHLWKGRGYREKFMQLYGFGYTRVGLNERKRGNAFSLDFWFNNRWNDRKYDLAWLVERFYPVPSWSEDRNTWTVLPTL